MALTRITDEKEIRTAYRSVFSIATKNTTRHNAVIGYRGGSEACRIAWNQSYGFWVLRAPNDWDKNLLVFGTEHPRTHTRASLNITVQINISRSANGRQRAGVLLSRNRRAYLGHDGGISGGKRGVGKAAFLTWYRNLFNNVVQFEEPSGKTKSCILIGKIEDSDRFLSSLSSFIFSVEKFKAELDALGSLDERIVMDSVEAADEGVFNPGNVGQTQQKTIRSINLRRGQPRFRSKLLKVYEGKCAFSGCDCEDALEAAHIRPYGGDQTNHVQNGLLLRCDLHTLLDIGRIGVDPDTLRIVVGTQIVNTMYRNLHGKKLRLPKDTRHHPNRDVLREHLHSWKIV